MSNSVIQLSAQTDHSYSAGELLDPMSRATIEFFDSYEPHPGSSKISFSSFDGLDTKESSGVTSLGFGEFRCISQACVSDVSVFESSSCLANVDPALLAKHILTQGVQIEHLGLNIGNQLSQLGVAEFSAQSVLDPGHGTQKL